MATFPHHEVLFEHNPWLLEPVDLPQVRVKNPNSKWRMASAWQKAIRRGDETIALTMLAGLIAVDPEYPFRRVKVIALEDIGWANWQLVKVAEHVSRLPKGAFAEKRVKALVNLTKLMVASKKSRAVCDLSCAAMEPKFFYDHLIPKVVPDSQLVVQCVLWWRNFGKRLQGPEGMPPLEGMGADLLRESLGQTKAGQSEAWVDLTMRLGSDRSMWGMPAAWASLHDRYTEIANAPTKDDLIGPVTMIGAYPSYTFDQHCNEGKRALAYFFKACPMIGEFLNDHGVYDLAKQKAMLNELVFVCDSGRLANRAASKLEYDCQWASEKKFFAPLTKEQITQFEQMMFDNMGVLNSARAKVVDL